MAPWALALTLAAAMAVPPAHAQEVFGRPKPLTEHSVSADELAAMRAAMARYQQERARPESRQGLLARLKGAFGGGNTGADKDVAESLIRSKARLQSDAMAQDAALAAIRRQLVDRHVPASILARHDATLATLGQRRAELMGALDQLQQAQLRNDGEQRRQLLDAINTKLQQWSGEPAAKVDFRNLPAGSPASKVRAPRDSKLAYGLHLEMFGIKPLQVAGPIPAGTVLPVLPQLPAEPQPADLAETEDVQLTPAIRAQAAALHNNPSEIYRWVHDTIQYVPTYGSIQGADYTLQSKRGNDMDTASLLIALLRAAGIPARYVYGTIELPIDQAQNWVGGVTSPNAVLRLLAQGGIPSTGIAQGGLPTAVQLEHVWVEAFVDYVPSRGVINKVPDTWVPMDASFKQYSYTAGISLNQAVPFDAQALAGTVLSGATVNTNVGSAQNMDPGLIQSALTTYQQRVQNYLAQYYPGATVGDVLGKQGIQPYPGKLLSMTLPMRLVAVAGDFQSLPDTMRHYLVYKVYANEQALAGDNAALSLRRSLPSLAGRNLALSYVPSTADDAAALSSFLPAPHADGTPIQPGELPASLPGYLINLSPRLTLDGLAVSSTTSAQMLGSNAYTRSGIEAPGQPLVLANSRLVAGQYHAIGLDLQGVSATQLAQWQTGLDSTRQALQSAPSSLTRDALYGQLLQAGIGTYFASNDLQDGIAARSAGVVSYRLPSVGTFASTLQPQLSYGIPTDVSAGGVAADIDQLAWTVSDRGDDLNRSRAWSLAAGSRMSASAHLVLEQIFSTPTQKAQGVSAVKVFQLAEQQGQNIYTLTPANVGTVLPTLALEPVVAQDIAGAVGAGRTVLTTQSSLTYAGWTGSAYVVLDPASLAGIYNTRASAASGVATPDLTGYLPQGLGFEITQSVPAGVAVVPVTSYSQAFAASSTQLTDVANHLVTCGNGTAPAMTCLAYPVGNLVQNGLSGLAAGSSSLSAFNLGTVLLAGGNPLAVSVQLNPASIQIGQTTYINLQVSGATTSSPTLQATVNGQPLTLDAAGTASFTPTAPGLYTVAATVTDGNVSTQGRATLTVIDPADTTQPVVSITSPVMSARITAPVDIIGTVQNSQLKEYVVAISPAGKQAYRTIARGTAPVTNGVLARFDPTLLSNGQWDIVVQATSLNGLSNSQKITVRVVGDLKLGNFAFTVTDVEVPLAGIPIRVTRTYDTRRKDESLDFGHGWSVGYQDGKVEKSRVLGQYWDLNQYRSGPMNAVVTYCVEPRGKPVVTVTLPGGKVETFEVTVTNACSLYVPQVDSLYFTYTPVDNTLSTLEEESPLPMILQGGALLDNGSLQVYDATLYKLTTKAGYVYHLDQGFGVRMIEDPNGNTITYTPNGILHSSGLSVTFDRDSNGRISAIHDPDGNVRRYVYDGNGDLKSAVEPVAANSTATAVPTTTYLYYGEADGFPHYLQEIRDPLNRTLIKNIYDNNGRLIAQEDGAGHRVVFNHNLTGRTSVVTNRRGFSTQYAYDDEGRILTQIDALGQTTTNVWDARGNLLKKTNPAGEVTSATYSDRNDVLTQTDGEGHTTAYTYNQRGQELTVKDALGRQYSMSYDSVGNLLTLTDPQQHVVGNLIGPKGLLQKTTDALGNSTRWTYDDQGRKKTETDALGHVTAFTYDSNGNVLTETRTRTVNGQAVAEVASHTYDSRNRETSTTDALGNTTRTEYDLAGNVSARVDALGHRTEMTYDAYGHLTQTKYPDGTTEMSTYDAEGNKISSTDRLGRVTTYVYDALNRLIQTTLPD